MHAVRPMAMPRMQLRTAAFRSGDRIPVQYTREGENLSPPLEWSGVPEGTVELALICDDPDAPQTEPFAHWVLYKIPPTVQSLPEGIMSEARLVEPFRAIQGRNAFGNIGYDGPMPPVGHGVHRYIFRLFALKSKLELEPGSDRNALLRAMEDHDLGSAHLIGTYERKAERKSA